VRLESASEVEEGERQTRIGERHLRFVDSTRVLWDVWWEYLRAHESIPSKASSIFDSSRISQLEGFHFAQHSQEEEHSAAYDG